MRKIVIGLILLLVVVLAVIYLFIPGRLKIGATTTLNATLPGVSRSLSDTNSWKNFWPAKPLFKIDDQEFLIKGKIFDAFNVDIASDSDTLSSIINLLLISTDSINIDWKSEKITSNNPFKRFVQYRKAIALEKNMKKILEEMKGFMEQAKNIYGFPINRTIVTDSALISTRRVLDHQPTVKDIDDIIQSLKTYIRHHNAAEQNFPMLNVRQLDSSHYEVMMAIPVDRRLPLTNDFAPKFLLKGGNILEAKITGGPYTIEAAFREFENYRSDYKYGTPAIRYQLLVTDRSKEPDTAKWITKIYYPIF